jgi:hypothetical protein
LSAREKVLERALRNVRLLALRLRRTDPVNAAHFIRFCEEAGVHAQILRDDTTREPTTPPPPAPGDEPTCVCGHGLKLHNLLVANLCMAAVCARGCTGFVAAPPAQEAGAPTPAEIIATTTATIREDMRQCAPEKTKPLVDGHSPDCAVVRDPLYPVLSRKTKPPAEDRTCEVCGRDEFRMCESFGHLGQWERPRPSKSPGGGR